MAIMPRKPTIRIERPPTNEPNLVRNATSHAQLQYAEIFRPNCGILSFYHQENYREVDSDYGYGSLWVEH